MKMPLPDEVPEIDTGNGGQSRRVLWRWVTFNVVGLMGVGVQLVALIMLHRWFDLDYLPATALAVEAAVLHNFLWHERWTWQDRIPVDQTGTWARLCRFNLTIGTMSIVQNLVLMELLAGRLHMHYVVANLVGITICSVVNFFASDRLVFRRVLSEAQSTDEATEPPL